MVMSSTWTIPVGCLHLTDFWQFLFSRNLYLDCWTPESPDFHPASLATPSQPPLPDYDLLKPRPSCLGHLPVYTNLFLNSRLMCKTAYLRVPREVPTASLTQISCLTLKPASSLVVPVSGHGASFSMVLRPKSLFIFCSDSCLTHQ